MIIYTMLLFFAMADKPAVLKDSVSYLESINASADLSPEEKARAISSMYLKEIAPLQNRLLSLTNTELHKIFKMTGMALFYAQRFDFDQRRRFLDDLKDDLREMERRHVAGGNEVAEVYEGLVSLRSFAEAKRFFDDHPHAPLAAIPPFVKALSASHEGPSLYELAPNERNLRLSHIDYKHGKTIVVVAHCHFARDAAREIADDPVLLDAFKRGNAIWVQSSAAPLDVVELRAWNAYFPDQRLSIAFDNWEWPEVDFSSSPGFFFFENGKLVSHWEGWSATTSRANLVKSLKRMGLLDID